MTQWTHRSVVALAEGGDPVAAVIERAKSLVFDAMEHGWSGPPFNPDDLARLRGISVVPRDSIRDARLLADPPGHFRIEFNPNQPRSRTRYSIAHEIAHTLFPDCGEEVRHRLTREEQEADDWQLEMLCNIAAAEILMPTGSFPMFGARDLTMQSFLKLRQEYEVSLEAILHRVLSLSRSPLAVFAASRDESREGQPFAFDYVRSSAEWKVAFKSGSRVPAGLGVDQCAVIGFTSRTDAEWNTPARNVRVECVAVPPYPGHQHPRVLGVAVPLDVLPDERPTIEFLVGDATDPRGGGAKIVAHVVNDGTPNWGAGFAKVVAKKWPAVQRDFADWVTADRSRLRLGSSHLAVVRDDLFFFQMVGQHGYGPSAHPRIRYAALETCLRSLAEQASNRRATVHMPRIGCGQAGGIWSVIEELVDRNLCRSGISVTVYDLPTEQDRWRAQQHQAQRPPREKLLF